jgi:hypothetical protein
MVSVVVLVAVKEEILEVSLVLELNPTELLELVQLYLTVTPGEVVASVAGKMFGMFEPEQTLIFAIGWVTTFGKVISLPFFSGPVQATPAFV